jgi:hypothetical protein
MRFLKPITICVSKTKIYFVETKKTGIASSLAMTAALLKFRQLHYIGFSSKYRASIRLISLMEFLAHAKRFSSISASDKCQSILSVAIYSLGSE